ncbi:MAG TPA: signal peptidase II [Desulfuromonadales bacterium]|nr:signal peptidase II [Desulfuromonadales bacterium]
MSRYRFFAIVSLVILVFDQATKLHIDHHFRLYESLPIIPGLLSLTYIRNPGAAFGIFADSSLRLPFFISVSLVAMLGILWILKQRENGQQPGNLGLALVFAGALGNLIDRIRLGEVIDFIDVYWRQYHWPAFNVADSAITVGVFLLLVEMWTERKNDQPE